MFFVNITFPSTTILHLRKNNHDRDMLVFPAGVYLVMIGNRVELIKTKLIKEN